MALNTKFMCKLSLRTVFFQTLAWCCNLCASIYTTNFHLVTIFAFSILCFLCFHIRNLFYKKLFPIKVSLHRIVCPFIGRDIVLRSFHPQLFLVFFCFFYPRTKYVTIDSNISWQAGLRNVLLARKCCSSFLSFCCSITFVEFNKHYYLENFMRFG